MMDLFLAGSMDELKSSNAISADQETKSSPTTLDLVMKVFDHKMFSECKKNIFDCVSN
jgi:hypothetical protein